MRFSADPASTSDGSRAFTCKKDHDFVFDIDRWDLYCVFYCQMSTRRASTPEKFGTENDQFRDMLTVPNRCVLHVPHDFMAAILNFCTKVMSNKVSLCFIVLLDTENI